MNNYLEVDVKDVKGFKVDLPGQFDRLGNNIEADVVYASAYDAALSKLAAENLRAEMAEAELDSWKETAATFEDFYRKTEAEKEGAEQRVSGLLDLLHEVQKAARKQAWAHGYPTLFANGDAALNPKPEAGSHED